MDAALVVASSLLAGAGAVLSWRAMARGLKRAKAHKGLPLITASEGTLLGSSGMWPLSRARWPRPSEVEGLEARWAYANAARRRSGRFEVTGEAGIIVVGAWLGLQLVTAGPAAEQYLVAVGEASAQNPFAIWPRLLGFTFAISSLFVLMIALGLKGVARRYREAADGYEVSAERKEAL